MNYTDFAKSIKDKYPQYKDIDDLELTKKVIQKYPVYKSQVDMGSIREGALSQIPLSQQSLLSPQLQREESALRLKKYATPALEAGGMMLGGLIGSPAGGLPGSALGSGIGAAAGRGIGKVAEAIASPSTFKETTPEILRGQGVVGATAAATDLGFGLAGKAIGGVYKGLKYYLSPDVKSGLFRAIKPNVKNVNFSKDVENVMPIINDTAKKNNIQINGIVDFNTAVKQAKNELWDKIEGVLSSAQEKLLGQSKIKTSMLIDGNEIADSMLKNIDKRYAMQNPAKIEEIKKIADTYRNRYFTPQEAEEYLESANSELYRYYNKNPKERYVAEKNPEIGHIVNEANNLRKQLYSQISKLTGEDAATLKKQYGSLANIQNESIKREIVAGRQNPFSLSEQIHYPFATARAGYKALRGLMGDPVALGEAAESGAQIGLAKAIKEANTTDNLIKNAFIKYNKEVGESLPYKMGKQVKQIDKDTANAINQVLERNRNLGQKGEVMIPGKSPETSLINEVKKYGNNVSYNNKLKSEAIYKNGNIEVGNKFFELPENSRSNIILHEKGHALSDEMLKDGSAFELADSGAFGEKYPNGKIRGINGQLTPGENVAEAYAVYMKEPEWLKKNYPKAYDVISKRADIWNKAHGK